MSALPRGLPVIESVHGCGACCQVVTLPPFRRRFDQSGEDAWERLKWDRPDLLTELLDAERAASCGGRTRRTERPVSGTMPPPGVAGTTTSGPQPAASSSWVVVIAATPGAAPGSAEEERRIVNPRIEPPTDGGRNGTLVQRSLPGTCRVVPGTRHSGRCRRGLFFPAGLRAQHHRRPLPERTAPRLGPRELVVRAAFEPYAVIGGSGRGLRSDDVVAFRLPEHREVTGHCSSPRGTRPASSRLPSRPRRLRARTMARSYLRRPSGAITSGCWPANCPARNGSIIRSARRIRSQRGGRRRPAGNNPGGGHQLEQTFDLFSGGRAVERTSSSTGRSKPARPDAAETWPKRSRPATSKGSPWPRWTGRRGSKGRTPGA